jgi:antibiotic biosynthesis monooxygenase (ABM) superfamily enzyme
MKKITLLAMVSLVPLVTNAQQNFSKNIGHLNMEVVRIVSTILVIVLVMIFVLSLMKQML